MYIRQWASVLCVKDTSGSDHTGVPRFSDDAYPRCCSTVLMMLTVFLLVCVTRCRQQWLGDVVCKSLCHL